MLGHFLNSHFLQVGFCLQSPPEVTNIALNRRVTIFSQSSSWLACLLPEEHFCSPGSRISMLLPLDYSLSVFAGFSSFWLLKQPSSTTHAMSLTLLETLQDPMRVTRMARKGSGTSRTCTAPARRSPGLLMTRLWLWWTTKSCTHPMPGHWLSSQALLPPSRHHCCRYIPASPLYFQHLFPGVLNLILFSPSPCPPQGVCHPTPGPNHHPLV